MKKYGYLERVIRYLKENGVQVVLFDKILPLSAFHPKLPHGAGLIALSVAYFSFMAEKCPERFVDLAQAMV